MKGCSLTVGKTWWQGQEVTGHIPSQSRIRDNGCWSLAHFSLFIWSQTSARSTRNSDTPITGHLSPLLPTCSRSFTQASSGLCLLGSLEALTIHTINHNRYTCVKREPQYIHPLRFQTSMRESIVVLTETTKHKNFEIFPWAFASKVHWLLTSSINLK